MTAPRLQEVGSNLHPVNPTFKREFLAAEKSVEFGERLKARRLALGITRQEDLGNAVGRSKNSICDWEAGTVPRASNLGALVSALLTTEDYLLFGIGPVDGPLPSGPVGRVRATLARFNWTPQDLAHAMAKRLSHWDMPYTLRFLAGLSEPTDDDLDGLAIVLNISPRSLVQPAAPNPVPPAPKVAGAVVPSHEHLALALELCDAASALRSNPWTAAQKAQAMLRLSNLLSEMDPKSRSRFQVALSILLA